MSGINKVPSIKPYGVAIQEVLASGDIEKMKVVAEQAEYTLNHMGEIREALAKIKTHINKLEKS